MTESLDPQVATALGQAGLRLRQFRRISTIRSAETGRAVYRIRLDDGREIKARRVEDERSASRLLEFQRCLPDGFVPAFARHGAVLLEPWIAGEELQGAPPDEPLLVEAGALLGELHATETVPGHPGHEVRSTAPWREATERGLTEIRTARGLEDARVARLLRAVEMWDPGSEVFGLVHTDFCGENMVVDRSGRLHVVDNERLQVDALPYDVARTWYRWALPLPAWEHFRSGYAARMPFPEPSERLGFWKIVAVVKSATLRAQKDRDRVAVPLEFLHRMAAELGGVAPGSGRRS